MKTETECPDCGKLVANSGMKRHRGGSVCRDRIRAHNIDAIATATRPDEKVWFAASSDVVRMGPFDSDVKAWKALESSANSLSGCRPVHAPGAYVWPEMRKPINVDDLFAQSKNSKEV